MLFQQIGWDDLIKNPAYGNTCAIRVSLALIRSGVTIPGGRLPIKRIEPGQASNPPLATIYFPIQNIKIYRKAPGRRRLTHLGLHCVHNGVHRQFEPVSPRYDYGLTFARPVRFSAASRPGGAATILPSGPSFERYLFGYRQAGHHGPHVMGRRLELRQLYGLYLPSTIIQGYLDLFPITTCSISARHLLTPLSKYLGGRSG
jgi:hypothetical protein